MQGVITKAHVLAHPVIIAEGFGLKVLLRALFASAEETFLEIVRRCAEEDAHSGMHEFDLVRTVDRFIGFECRARDLYQELSRQLAGNPAAAKFFRTLARQEEGHAVVLSRVSREIGAAGGGRTRGTSTWSAWGPSTPCSPGPRRRSAVASRWRGRWSSSRRSRARRLTSSSTT